MTTIDDIRHQRLLQLIAELGTVKRLADAIGRAPAQISQLKTRQPHSQTGSPRMIGSELAREIEAKLGKPTGWMDIAPNPVELAAMGRAPKAGPVIAWSSPADLHDDEFALVDRRAVKLSAGTGQMVFDEEPLPPLAFRAEFLRSKRVSRRENLVIVYAEGDSMEPAIVDGDAVLCDRGQTEVIDGEIYAIDYGGVLKVKRLRKRFDGGLVIISDNAAKHPAEALTADQATHITVLGRVLWRGGSL